MSIGDMYALMCACRKGSPRNRLYNIGWHALSYNFVPDVQHVLPQVLHGSSAFPVRQVNVYGRSLRNGRVLCHLHVDDNMQPMTFSILTHADV